MTCFFNDNGEYLDYSGEDIGLTKQFANFFESKIKGDVSSNLKLPNNPQNRKALGYYGANQIGVVLEQDFTMQKNGNNVARGKFVITESDEYIEGFFVSGNTNWFQFFEFNLREILFPSSMSTLMNNVTGRKDATEGIIFPLVDYWAYGQKSSGYFKIPQTFSTNEVAEITEVHPWLYLHSIVRYLSEYANVVIGGDLLTDPLFKKIIISTPGPEYFVPENLIQKTNTFIQAGPFGSAAAGLYNYLLDPQPVRFNTVLEGANYLDSSTFTFTPPATGTYRFEWILRANATDTYTLQLYKNGALDTILLSSFGVTASTDVKGVQWANLVEGNSYQIYVNNGLSSDYRLDYVLTGTTRVSTSISIKLEPIGGVMPYPSIGSGTQTGYALPGFCVPNMKAIDLIKFLVSYFACYVVYDQEANKISLNKISSLKKEDAEDWSDYFISHKTKWNTGVAEKNLITNEETEEDNIVAFNESNNVTYGGGSIDTSFDTVAEKNLFNIPFGGTWDWRNRSIFNMFLPYCKFYSLEEVQRTTYSAVTNSGGKGQFTSTWDDPTREVDLFLVVSASGAYNGYFMASASGGATNPVLLVDYVATDTGTIIKFRANKISGPNRMMICEAGRNFTDWGGSSVSVVDVSGAVSQSTGPMCWFDKTDLTVKDNLVIDSYNESLAIDSDKTKSITISERYYGPIKNVFNNPKEEVMFNLPVGVFSNYSGGYIYLKTKDLTGYFIVQKIENYKDETTPVKCELLYID